MSRHGWFPRTGEQSSSDRHGSAHRTDFCARDHGFLGSVGRVRGATRRERFSGDTDLRGVGTHHDRSGALCARADRLEARARPSRGPVWLAHRAARRRRTDAPLPRCAHRADVPDLSADRAVAGGDHRALGGLAEGARHLGRCARYRTRARFIAALRLRAGRAGWRLRDCLVRLLAHHPHRLGSPGLLHEARQSQHASREHFRLHGADGAGARPGGSMDDGLLAAHQLRPGRSLARGRQTDPQLDRCADDRVRIPLRQGDGGVSAHQCGRSAHYCAHRAGPPRHHAATAQVDGDRARLPRRGAAGHRVGGREVKALLELLGRHRAGEPVGIYSVCSAHPLVLRAALQHAHALGGHALIEATSNQVNQEGGYTGLRPAEFRDVVCRMADEIELPRHRVLLGGDHLGPNCWQTQPAESALQRAGVLVAEYVRAGFRKIHLDCSMSLSDDPRALSDELIAERAAKLCTQAEDAWQSSGGEAPVYVIGSEVPVPGGAHETLHELAVTEPQVALASIAAHRAAFLRCGLEAAWERVIALVAQPGVEFDQERVVAYTPSKAQRLSACLESVPRLVFEAHSTDYQTAQALAALVRDHFAILKVGPALTFALREAVWALDQIEREWLG